MVWQEVGDRIYRRRFESLDLNVGLIVADEAALVIDSRATHLQADEVIAEIAEVTALPVRHLVNTHHHWDHTFGNARFTGAEIIGHARCRSTLIEKGPAMRQRLVDADWVPEEAKPHFAAVEIVPPERTFEESLTVHLDDRRIELRHLGRGHTDNDIVIEVDDVMFVGDLVEEGAPPQFGDAYPRDWIVTLDAVIARARSVVVPGHGDVVGAGFIETQRDQILRAIDGEAVFPDQTMEQLTSRLEVS